MLMHFGESYNCLESFGLKQFRSFSCTVQCEQELVLRVDAGWSKHVLKPLDKVIYCASFPLRSLMFTDSVKESSALILPQDQHRQSSRDGAWSTERCSRSAEKSSVLT